MADPALSPAYQKLPEPLKNTMVQSHSEYVKGWPGRAFADYIGDLESHGQLAVIEAVYARCLKESKLWPFIKAIVGPWTYAQGHDISQGFNFLCDRPDDLLTLLRGSSRFCEDDPTTTVHGPRDCFRELITSGSGLHVCVVRTASRNSHWHDIHIDKYQAICTRKEDGFCDYHYLNSNFVDHMKDVVPWWVGERAKEAGKAVGKALEQVGEFQRENRGPKW